jgi:hypothetical protein
LVLVVPERKPEMIVLPEDRRIVKSLLIPAMEKGDGAKPLHRLIVETGMRLLGAPYRANTLERSGPERLVINLRAFDCVTFVENAVVLAALIREGKTTFKDYAEALERIRYRHGRPDGYPSRLHYFTDWMWDNERKGLVRDITSEIGGTPFTGSLHAVTDLREKCPQLKEADTFRRMRIMEAASSRRTKYHILKADLRRVEKKITDGDIIAITAEQEGLDVCHVGIAVHVRGRLRLLHASSKAEKVVLSDEGLDRYLESHSGMTGIIVGRATDRAQRNNKRPNGSQT